MLTHRDRIVIAAACVSLGLAANAFSDWHQPATRVQVYHDSSTSSSARIHVNMCRNLLGHFRTDVGWADVSGYATNRNAAATDVAIYLGSDSASTLPPEFLGDMLDRTGTTVWLGYGLPQLLAVSGAVERLGLVWHGSSNGYDQVFYKGTALERPSSAGALSAVDAVPPTEILATANAATNPALPALPYALRRGGFWYLPENPFRTYRVPGHSLVLADLLHDILGTGVTTNNWRALVRFEDLHPAAASQRPYMVPAVEAMHALGVRPAGAVIPRSVYPTNEPPTDMPMSASRPFQQALQDCVRQGMIVVCHGYTHQNDEESERTGIGSEFWARLSQRPLTNDSVARTTSRLQAAELELARCGFPCFTWETPHYQGSLLDYAVFAAHYDTIYETVPVFNVLTEPLSAEALAAVSQVSTNLLTQSLPYPAYSSVYGARLLPENLGYYGPGTFDGDGHERTVSNKVHDARQLKVVRDAVASFYFHLQFGADTIPTLTNLVRQLQAEGYTFTDIEALSHEEAAP